MSYNDMRVDEQAAKREQLTVAFSDAVSIREPSFCSGAP
jgi:hypothetical protein